MIPDFHNHPIFWGVRPILFSFKGYSVSSYSFFILLGLISAVALYYFNIKKKSTGHNGIYIALAAFIGGVIGAKIPIWIANFRLIISNLNNPAYILSGRTIVGGIVGGALTVFLTKKFLGIKEKLGNNLVPSLCIGIFFGRIGCFLQGCCYGKKTNLPWGVNFGDGILRHPTQIYEAIFVFCLFVYAQINKEKYAPGELFRRFMIVYFAYRFFAEFLRINPVTALGFTYYQIASLLIVVYYLFKDKINVYLKGVLHG